MTSFAAFPGQVFHIAKMRGRFATVRTLKDDLQQIQGIGAGPRTCARPAVERAYAKAKEVNPNFGQPAIRTEEERKILFGQTAAVVR